MRRYVPVVLPSFMLWTSYLIYQIYKKGTFYKLFSMMIMCTIIVSYIFSDGYTSIVSHTEYLGAINQIDSLAKTFHKNNNSVVVFMEGNSNFVGTPLQYMYNVDSLTFRGSDKTILKNIVSTWMSNGKNVYIVSGDNDIGIFNTLKFTLDNDGIISVPTLERTYDRKPSNIMTYNISYRIYKIGELNDTNMLSFLDIGYNDYGLTKGFYGPEKSNVTYRWTSKYSDVLLPVDSSKNNSIFIRMCNARPEILSNNTNLIIYVDNQTVGNISIGNTFDVYHIDIPSEYVVNKDRIILTIETVDTWRPSDTLNSQDPRELGVIIDWIKINNTDKKY